MPWYMPNSTNGYKRYVRVVVISEDAATTYINLLNPKESEFVIRNNTRHPVVACQVGGSQELTLQPDDRLSFIFENQIAPVKKVRVTVGKYSAVFNISDLNKKLPSLGIVDVKYAVVDDSTTRQLDIGTHRHTGRKLCSAADILADQKTYQHSKSSISLSVLIPEIQVSIIDEDPKELLLLSIIGINMSFKQNTKADLVHVTVDRKIEFDIVHVQIDNMHRRTNEFPIIFCPVRPFDHSDPTKNTTPFIRAALEYSYTNVQKSA